MYRCTWTSGFGFWACRDLPRTGFDAPTLVTLGVVLLLLGLFAIRAADRRQRRRAGELGRWCAGASASATPTARSLP
jgi:LPXTG-motif cell wall-anchored protein